MNEDKLSQPWPLFIDVLVASVIMLTELTEEKEWCLHMTLFLKGEAVGEEEPNVLCVAPVCPSAFDAYKCNSYFPSRGGEI